MQGNNKIHNTDMYTGMELNKAEYQFIYEVKLTELSPSKHILFLREECCNAAFVPRC